MQCLSQTLLAVPDLVELVVANSDLLNNGVRQTSPPEFNINAKAHRYPIQVKRARIVAYTIAFADSFYRHDEFRSS